MHRRWARDLLGTCRGAEPAHHLTEVVDALRRNGESSNWIVEFRVSTVAVEVSMLRGASVAGSGVAVTADRDALVIDPLEVRREHSGRLDGFVGLPHLQVAVIKPAGWLVETDDSPAGV